MSDSHNKRIEDALSSLVDKIVGSDTDDEATADARHAKGLRTAKSILERYGNSAVVSDVNHAADLIKKKLLAGNATPEKAFEFSNLYTRLLTQPVLSQKWAILYLLYQLADSGLPDPQLENNDGYLSRVDLQDGSQAGHSLRGFEGNDNEGVNPRQGTSAFNEAFSSKGIPPLGNKAPARSSTPSTRSPRYHERSSVSPQSKNTQKVSNPSSTTIAAGQKTNVEGTKETLVVANIPEMEPSEKELLRDLPFTLQGLSSKHLIMSGSTLKLPSTLPPPVISLLHALAEPSLLYRNLAKFVESSDGGLISQSLRAAISNELRSYLTLVATLETEIRNALATISKDQEDQSSSRRVGVTLKRCVIWTREATMGLRLMSLIVEESRNKKGGQLVSLVHGFVTSHGDPFVVAFAERLLSHVTRPFYDMLRQWIYDGELSDPFLEFFVSEQQQHLGNENPDPRRGGATSVWEDKYKLDDDMIPSIITKDFAKKIFLIGKSLNFIRYGCGDSTWVEAYSRNASKELRYGDTASLETSIDEAYKTTMARLIHLMTDKFKLFDHLRALKKYLLLGQGDFIALLMESLSSNLDRPANTLQRHNLTSQLEHAIIGSNAQFDPPDVLRRLDARMLDISHGEIGWDVFTLEYKIDAPVDVIVTPYGGRQYLKVFNFLWRIKRVEFALGSTWRRCMTGARGVLAAVADKVGAEWKVARCCVAEMIHFVCQLQYYILFEVIESSWDALEVAINKPNCTLDDLIEAHAKYLQAITHKGLLGSARSGSSGSKEDSFLAQLHEILKIMLAYKDAVDGLYSFSVAEFTKRQEMSAKIETRTAQGKWGITERDEDDDLRSPTPGLKPNGSELDSPFPAIHAADDQMLPALHKRLSQLSGDFKARVNILLGDLAYQPDVDMRFLGVVMNFNDVYEPVRRKRKEAKGDKEKRHTPKSTVTGTAS